MQVRIAHGYEGQREAARAIGINAITYAHHENGRRNPSVQAVEIYARHFGVTSDFLLYGMNPKMPRRGVPVVGAISSGGKIVDLMHAANHDAPEFIQAIGSAVPGLEAVRVETDDLVPAYRPGDLVFYAPPGPGLMNPENVSGQECVVTLGNGMKLLCVCHANADGLWTLERYNAPAMHGAVLLNASPVLGVQRSAFLHPRAQSAT